MPVFENMRKLKSLLHRLPFADKVRNFIQRRSRVVYRSALTTFRPMIRSSFERLWQKHSTFPSKIGLSLSLHCPSQCIYCPTRGAQIHPASIPRKLVLTILDQAKKYGFKGQFSIGENGESLTNPEFLDIIGDIRNAFPENEIVFFSNMVLMNESAAKRLLSMGLSFIHFNFDGATETTYDFIKHNRSFETVKKNIAAFFEWRDKLNSSCTIGVGYVTAHSFYKNMIGDPCPYNDDSDKILSFIRPLLRKGDYVHPEEFLLNKYQESLNRAKGEPCDAFPSLLEKALIAPNGSIYLCCADFAMTTALGDINKQTMGEIWSGEARKQALRSLYLLDYATAPKVCRTCPPHLRFNADLYYKVREEIRNKGILNKQ
jgi:radical SAM protein with 4Fe4S-binding SPASM domain